MELSSTMSTDINLPFITADQSGPKHLNVTLTRAKFEQLVDDLIQRTLPPMQQALKDAGLDPKQIDEVVREKSLMPAITPPAGLMAFLTTNAFVFTIAHQVFGDPFVLIILGFFVGFILAMPKMQQKKTEDARRTLGEIDGRPIREVIDGRRMTGDGRIGPAFPVSGHPSPVISSGLRSSVSGHFRSSLLPEL
jgi:hypothetical protein